MTTTGQPVSVSLAKAALRQSIAGQIRRTDASARRAWDATIQALIADSRVFVSATRVVGYFALADEVNIDALLATAVEAGKQVLVPMVRADRMLFAQWTPCTSLRRSQHRVLEVVGEGLEACEIGACLMLLPGRVFDLAGGRVGRGAGWYDRALTRRATDACVAGVGYEIQVVDAVPEAGHDRRMDVMFTERGVARCG